MAKTSSATFVNRHSNPLPYRVPAFIAFKKDKYKLLFSTMDLAAFIQREEEFVIQRFVASPMGRAMKIRAKWDHQTGFSSRKLCHKSSFPFNSPSSLKPKPRIKVRRSSNVSNTELKLGLSNAQQLRFPVLFSSAKSPSPSHSALKLFSSFSSASVTSTADDPYTVSFSNQADAYEDCTLIAGLQSSAMDIVTALKEANGLQGLDMLSVEFDMMQGVDSLWYFLDVKEMTTESIEQRVESRLEALGHHMETPQSTKSLRRTLQKLEAFFLSDQSLIQHKAPFVPRPARFSSLHD